MERPENIFFAVFSFLGAVLWFWTAVKKEYTITSIFWLLVSVLCFISGIQHIEQAFTPRKTNEQEALLVEEESEGAQHTKGQFSPGHSKGP